MEPDSSWLSMEKVQREMEFFLLLSHPPPPVTPREDSAQAEINF